VTQQNSDMVKKNFILLRYKRYNLLTWVFRCTQKKNLGF